MELFTKAIQRGLNAYRNRDAYTYFFGAKGQVLTRKVMDQLWAAEQAYFSKYSIYEKEQIYRNSEGKIGGDCSWFTGWICTGDRQWSYGQISNCSIITTPREGVAGSLLFTTFGGRGRHIGLDIGYGWALDTGYESTDIVVARNDQSIRLTRISETAWEKSGRSRLLDYTGATNL